MAYRQVARVFRDGTLTGMSDRLLLERYVNRRDQLAFEAIMDRHGPMVWNVCRRILRNTGDIDDAYQATFLALIRKAGSIKLNDSLGPWLHTVANRVAARARGDRVRKEALEPSQGGLDDQPSQDRFDDGENARVVHEELGRLPERLRAPIVLCYLEGLTHEMAASQLHCPVGTVRSRLARARVVLHGRMLRRGVTFSVGAVAALLEASSKAEIVPPRFRRHLVDEAMRSLSETAIVSLSGGAGISASAITLMEGVLNVMRIKALSVATAGLASVGILVGVIGTTALSLAGPPEEPAALVVDTEGRTSPKAETRDPWNIETFARTYPVGDLITPKPSGPTGQTPASAPRIDMMALIRLISSTIEPGSWKIFDGQGNDVSAEVVRWNRSQKRDAAEPGGSITPFSLSLSLIVRTQAETHEKVATLLRGLRGLDYVRDNPGKRLEDLEEEEERIAGPTEPEPNPKPAIKHDPQVSPTVAKVSAGPKTTGSRARIDRLLNELRKEITKLPAD